MNELYHHGIKGQKWGVRRTPEQLGHKSIPKNRDKPDKRYDPPYSKEEVLKNYGPKLYNKLSKDPAHKFRMDTGIELIHQEPSIKELNRIFKNWNYMSDSQKRISDDKCKELFGMSNNEYYEYLILNVYIDKGKSYVHDLLN